jgi:CO/xanthine dehydrogenase FAD-binding subunit
MEFLQPRLLADALAAKAEVPGAVPIAGGTDVTVEINFDVRRPEALLDLNRVPELTAAPSPAAPGPAHPSRHDVTP